MFKNRNSINLFFLRLLVMILSESSIGSLPPLDIYYQSIKTDYDNFEIDQLWDRLMTYDFPPVDSQYYGVINDEPLITDSIHCRYDAVV